MSASLMADALLDNNIFIQFYNLIVQRESTIVDLRTYEQFLRKHILTAIHIQPPFLTSLKSLDSNKKAVVLCFEDDQPTPELIQSIHALERFDTVVSVEFNRFSQEYPFLCTSRNSPTHEDANLSEYPARLPLFSSHALIYNL